jgi:hypothetical protein
MLTDDELRAAYDGADQSTAGWHILGLRAVADAVLAKAIPPGFVVVPAEPTKAMLAAADKIMDCAPRWVARGYRAMIEAAPPPAAPEPSEAEVEAAFIALHGAPSDYMFTAAMRVDAKARVRDALRAAAAARTKC